MKFEDIVISVNGKEIDKDGHREVSSIAPVKYGKISLKSGERVFFKEVSKEEYYRNVKQEENINEQ